MSWRSLFAFDNPTGNIGSQFTAINSLTLDGDFVAYLGGIQTLATFPSLPVGVYSVSVSFPLTTANASIIIFWTTGAGIATTSSTIAFALGSTSIVGFPITTLNASANTTQIANFILNNTSGSSPILINSVSNVFPVPGGISLTFGATFSTTASIVATKLA